MRSTIHPSLLAIWKINAGTFLVGKHLEQLTGFLSGLPQSPGAQVKRSLLTLTLAISKGLTTYLKAMSVGQIQLSILIGESTSFSCLQAFYTRGGFSLLTGEVLGMPTWSLKLRRAFPLRLSKVLEAAVFFIVMKAD